MFKKVNANLKNVKATVAVVGFNADVFAAEWESQIVDYDSVYYGDDVDAVYFQMVLDWVDLEVIFDESEEGISIIDVELPNDTLFKGELRVKNPDDFDVEYFMDAMGGCERVDDDIIDFHDWTWNDVKEFYDRWDYDVVMDCEPANFLAALGEERGEDVVKVVNYYEIAVEKALANA